MRRYLTGLLCCFGAIVYVLFYTLENRGASSAAIRRLRGASRPRALIGNATTKVPGATFRFHGDDDECDVLLCGMSGVGKSTLLHNIKAGTVEHSCHPVPRAWDAFAEELRFHGPFGFPVQTRALRTHEPREFTMQRETPAAPRKRKPSDVDRSAKTLSPIKHAGTSTMRRIENDSSDEERPVVPRPRPSAAARRGVATAILGATAGAGKRGDPQTVEERTAVELLARVCGGNVRPPRLDPVSRGQAGKEKYFCPFCFWVNEDDSAGAYCHPLEIDPRAGEPMMSGGRTPKPTGRYWTEWKDQPYQVHLGHAHGFPPKKSKGGGYLGSKKGVGTGNNGHNPSGGHGGPFKKKKKDPEKRQWRLRFGSGFQIDSVRIVKKK